MRIRLYVTNMVILDLLLFKSLDTVLDPNEDGNEDES